MRRVLTLSLVLAAAACSSASFDQPSASSFHAGSCRELAPSVLALGKDLHGLGPKTPSTGQRTALKTHQGDLRTRQAGLDPASAHTVQDLVTEGGIVRLRTDTNSYVLLLAKDALTAYQGVVKACTT